MVDFAESGELAERIHAQLKQDLNPVKPLPSSAVLAGRFFLILMVLGGLLTVWLGGGGIENMTSLQLLLVACILSAGALLLAVSLSWQMVPGKYQRIPPPVLIGAFAAGFLVVVAGMFPWNAADVLRTGWGCTRIGLMMAVPVGVALLYLAMRGAPLSYPTLGASLGAAAGLLGLTVLQFSCHNQEASHILVQHGAVVLLCIGVGYLLGRLAEFFTARARG